MKNILFALLLITSFCQGQELFVQYKSWKYGDSTYVVTTLLDSSLSYKKWYAKQDMKSAVAFPKENQYWTATRIITAPAPEMILKSEYTNMVLFYEYAIATQRQTIANQVQLIDSLKSAPKEIIYIHDTVYAASEPVDTPVAYSGPTRTMLKASFDLDSAATVSASISVNGIMKETLFSNKKFPAGKHEIVTNYDSTEGLTIDVLDNNIEVTWDGVLGNTSDSMSGPSVHRGMGFIHAIMPYGDKLFVSKLYGEKRLVQNELSLSNIQLSNKILKNKPPGGSQSTTHIATDGINVYWAGGDAYRPWNTFVFATPYNNSNVETVFQYGVPYAGHAMPPYVSTIAFLKDSLYKSPITGCDVQKTGSLIFTAREKLNSISVDHKTSGLHITDISITSPNGISVDENDQLVICTGTNVNRYSVSSTGELELLTAIPGFERPLSVSAKNNLILVADAGGSNQIKAYNYAGDHLWTHGQYGGQEISAPVTYDKFSLPRHASVAIQDDGSFWFSDIGNNRLIHFNSDRTVKEELSYLPSKYHAWVDPNATNKVYTDWSQYDVDFDKPIKQSWKLVNNWRPQIDTNIRNAYDMGLKPVTFSNGKQYCMFHYRIPNIVKVRYEYHVFELQANGIIRNTGVRIPFSTPSTIQANGDIWVSPITQNNLPTKFTKYPFIGYDGDNPKWGPLQLMAEVKHPRPDDPFSYAPNAGYVTTNGTIIKYDQTQQKANTFHVGGIKIGDTAYSFRTSLSTGVNYFGIYPENDAFDDGNGVVNAGNMAVALHNLFITGYKGEFWKALQTNMYNLFHESGLMLFQFGVDGLEGTKYEAYPGMAGNAFVLNLFKHGDDYILVHNDEGHQSGAHVWRIKNTKSIRLRKLKPVKFEQRIDTNRIDLMAGIPYDVVLNDSVAGYNRFPKTENYLNAGTNFWKIQTYTRSYERSVPDVAVTYAGKSLPDSAFITRDLGVVNSNDWELSGKISIGGSYNAINNFNQYDTLATESYVEVLDVNGKPIFRWFSQQGKDRVNVMVNTNINGQRIRTDSVVSFTNKVKDFNDFSIKCMEGLVTFKFLGGSYTVPAQGVFMEPSKFRLYFASKRERLNRFYSVKELTFRK